jgi:hypothetical protein
LNNADVMVMPALSVQSHPDQKEPANSYVALVLEAASMTNVDLSDGDNTQLRSRIVHDAQALTRITNSFATTCQNR